MTCKELIKFIQKNGLEDYVVQVQYRDDGGYYQGTDDRLDLCIAKAGTVVKYAGCEDSDRLIL